MGGLHAFGKYGTGDSESPDHSQGWVVQPPNFWFVLRSVWRSGCTVDVCVLRFWEGSDHCKQASKFLCKLLAVR